ncbi:hypothetical protein TNCV_871301 [Trichonephila clavipes]|nr:hypothetical protein TNCV_871301 [Trichonephila clavipes]
MCCEKVLGPVDPRDAIYTKTDQAKDALDRPVVEKTATSDESRFNLNTDDNRVRVRRPRGERLNPAFCFTATHCSHSWCDGMGCHFLQYTVTCSIDTWHHKAVQWYVHDILQPHVLPLMQRLP